MTIIKLLATRSKEDISRVMRAFLGQPATKGATPELHILHRKGQGSERITRSSTGRAETQNDMNVRLYELRMTLFEALEKKRKRVIIFRRPR